MQLKHTERHWQRLSVAKAILDVYSVIYYTKGDCQGKTQQQQPELGLNFEAAAAAGRLDHENGHPKTFQWELHKIFLLEQQVFL